MNKRNIFITISCIILLLGIIFPAIPLVYGFVILYMLWSEAGGMSYGNPYKKRMIEERRASINRKAHAPIKEENSIHKKQDFPTIIVLMGFGYILYGAVLVLLFWVD